MPDTQIYMGFSEFRDRRCCSTDCILRFNSVKDSEKARRLPRIDARQKPIEKMQGTTMEKREYEYGKEASLNRRKENHQSGNQKRS